jgi:predicted alpha/beta hydrolase family esterase
MKLYIIPGLGFDHRMFNNLDFSGFQATFLDWIKPLQNESISDYALRFSEKIDDSSSEKTVIIGHSLGGIMASEIARIKKVVQIILISSIRSNEENSFQFKIIKPLGIHHLFTKKLTFSTLKEY